MVKTAGSLLLHSLTFGEIRFQSGVPEHLDSNHFPALAVHTIAAHLLSAIYPGAQCVLPLR